MLENAEDLRGKALAKKKLKKIKEITKEGASMLYSETMKLMWYCKSTSPCLYGTHCIVSMHAIDSYSLQPPGLSV